MGIWHVYGQTNTSLWVSWVPTALKSALIKSSSWICLLASDSSTKEADGCEGSEPAVHFDMVS